MLFLAFVSINAHGQLSDTTRKHMYLVGVKHSEEIYDSSGDVIEHAHLFDLDSRNGFCELYPKIRKLASRRPILFIVEGTPAGFCYLANEDSKDCAMIPSCIPDGTPLVGADDRTDWDRLVSNNECFEETMLYAAQYYVQRGYFCVVVMGALHVLRIEKEQGRFHSTLCVTPETQLFAQSVMDRK